VSFKSLLILLHYRWKKTTSYLTTFINWIKQSTHITEIWDIKQKSFKNQMQIQPKTISRNGCFYTLWDFHSSDCSDHNHFKCDTIWSCTQLLLMFWRNVPHPSWWLKCVYAYLLQNCGHMCTPVGDVATYTAGHWLEYAYASVTWGGGLVAWLLFPLSFKTV
jgi:hypothetical protein